MLIARFSIIALKLEMIQMFLRKKAWEEAAKCEQLPSDERLHLPSFSFSICEMRIMKATLSQSCFLSKWFGKTQPIRHLSLVPDIEMCQ